MAFMVKKVRKCAVQEMKKRGREFNPHLCTHLCMNRRMCACEYVSKNACVREKRGAEQGKGRQRPMSNRCEKEWGWGIVHSPFRVSAVKNK